MPIALPNCSETQRVSQVNAKWYLLHTEAVEPTSIIWGIPTLKIPETERAAQTDDAQPYLNWCSCEQQSVCTLVLSEFRIEFA
jgi:hypothetical protein